MLALIAALITFVAQDGKIHANHPPNEVSATMQSRTGDEQRVVAAAIMNKIMYVI